AEGRRAEGEGVGAAPDADVRGGERFDGLHVEAAVGEVERNAVLEDADAATVEGALEAGAADGEAGFVGAEAGLRDDAGGEREGVVERGGAAAEETFRIHNFDTARREAEVGA